MMFILPFASGGVRRRRCLQRGWNRNSPRQKGELRAPWQETTWDVQQLLPHHFPALTVGSLQAACVLGAGVEAECGFHVSRDDQTSQDEGSVSCVSVVLRVGGLRKLCQVGGQLEPGFLFKGLLTSCWLPQSNCCKTFPGLSPACCTCSF